MPYAKTTILTCAVCGNTFHKRQKDQVCCSHACGLIYRTKVREPKPCLACHNPFVPKYKAQVYCSAPCADTKKRVDRRVVCKTCGETFERPHGKYMVYCSRSCASKRDTNTGGIKTNPQEGDTRNHSSGYIQEKRGGLWVMQHRLVVGDFLGRVLEKHERVHHKNGNRADNSTDNLELWVGPTKKDPHGVRLVDKVLDLIKGLTQDERLQVIATLKDY